MKILGIQKDHNASACLYINQELVYYNQEERLSRKKKDSGLPIRTLQQICEICPEIDVLLISGYDSVYLENLSIISIIQKLGFSLSKKFEFKSYYKGHHLFHASKAFYNSKFENALVIVYDGRGSAYNLNNGYQAYETTSIFSASYPIKFDLLYRRFFTPDEIDDSTSIIWDNGFAVNRISKPDYLSKKTKIEIRNDFDLGFMYEGTSRNLGFDDEGGKMMSLQSFGKFDDLIPRAVNENDEFNMDVFKFNELKQIQGFNFLSHPEFYSDEKKINFAFDVQNSFQKIGLKLIKEYLEKTGHTNLVITGGAALNVVANYFYRKNLPSSINIFIEPLCGDEGNCIGICEYYIREKYRSSKIKNTMSMYIGGLIPNYEYDLLEKETEINNATPEIVAELLRAGHIVSIFQGKSEAGPRALGNRSILFDPRIKNGKDLVNTVKGRELFRPFAASIMSEYVNDWFDMCGLDESPYMMYAVQVRKDKENLIPAVLHIDGSCRVQTITENQNKIMYEILKKYEEKTGIPLILNTSFNLAGDPIVETVKNAIDSLRKSSIEYLYLPDIKKIIYVPNLK